MAGDEVGRGEEGGSPIVDRQCQHPHSSCLQSPGPGDQSWLLPSLKQPHSQARTAHCTLMVHLILFPRKARLRAPRLKEAGEIELKMHGGQVPGFWGKKAPPSIAAGFGTCPIIDISPGFCRA